MNIREAAQEYGDISRGIYNIGFINSDGMNDETEFFVDDLEDLVALFGEFCRENGFTEDSVTYIGRVGLTVRELNRDQLNQFKESFALLEAAMENRSCSLDDLLESHDRITDEEVYEYYDGTLFSESEEDFYI